MKKETSNHNLLNSSNLQEKFSFKNISNKSSSNDTKSDFNKFKNKSLNYTDNISLDVSNLDSNHINSFMKIQDIDYDKLMQYETELYEVEDNFAKEGKL